MRDAIVSGTCIYRFEMWARADARQRHIVEWRSLFTEGKETGTKFAGTCSDSRQWRGKARATHKLEIWHVRAKFRRLGVRRSPKRSSKGVATEWWRPHISSKFGHVRTQLFH
jgi:hypothetical protein